MVVSVEALGGNTMSETTLHQLAKGFGALLIRSKVRTDEDDEQQQQQNK
jgi:hypothetical protein